MHEMICCPMKIVLALEASEDTSHQRIRYCSYGTAANRTFDNLNVEHSMQSLP